MSAARPSIEAAGVITTTRMSGVWLAADEGFALLRTRATDRVVVDAHGGPLAFIAAPASGELTWPGGFAAVRVRSVRAPVEPYAADFEQALRAHGVRRAGAHELWTYHGGAFSGLVAVEPCRIARRPSPQRRRGGWCRWRPR